VSMGATAAWNLYQGVRRLAEIIACEALIGAEALEHATLPSSDHVQGLHSLLRSVAPALTGDRSTSDELLVIASCVVDGGWLARMEAEHGRLPR